jgi:hypothetical protein
MGHIRSTNRAAARRARRRPHGLVRGLAALALLASAQPSAAESAAGPDLEVESARWESGYGAKFFQVVGTVANPGERPLGAVLIKTELLDAAGKVVATVECWNGRAEALGDLRGEAAEKKLTEAKVEPIAPGGSDKWRCTALDEDAPGATSHRAQVAVTLPAR